MINSKLETLNSKQTQNSNVQNSKQYNLGERTLKFSNRKDFLMRIKISRKESKESRYWLELSEPNTELNTEKERLIEEATELMKIFGSIVEKSK